MDAPKTPEAQDSTWFERTIAVVAYPVSGIIGLFAAHRSARDSVYDTLKHTPSFDPMRKEHWEKVKELTEPVGDILKTELPKEHARFSELQNKFFRERGFHTTFDYLKAIHPNEKMNAGLAFLTGAGVTLTVMLTVADNFALFKRLTKREPKADEQTPVA